jgi:hypothetical protein
MTPELPKRYYPGVLTSKLIDHPKGELMYAVEVDAYISSLRDEVLEEAAKACEMGIAEEAGHTSLFRIRNITIENCAAAIRAKKGKPK